MKWYFAIAEATLGRGDHDFAGMMKAAVASARRNTTLDPVLIYDGAENGLTRDLRRMGTAIVPHRFSLADRIVELAPPGYPVALACGAYMRTDIPELETEDELVLYTDCDVIFRTEPNFLADRPAFFACAPEFDPVDYVNINSGVMLMNLPALRRDLAGFRTFFLELFARSLALDQVAYQRFYAGRWDRLRPEANWKPYWGENAAAEIVHFHGPKPAAVRKYLADPGHKLLPSWRELLDRGGPAYQAFLWEWTQYRALADLATGRTDGLP